MTIQEISTKLFQIRGEGRITIAYAIDKADMPPIEVKNGRCLYLARLELAPQNHSELQWQRFGLGVTTTKKNRTYERHSGYTGWRGEVISFEKLTQQTHFPDERVATKTEADTAVKEALAGILGKWNYDYGLRIYSEFDGYPDGFGHRFDERRTYLPIIVQAIEEVRGKI